MKTLKILIYLFIIINFILIGFLLSEYTSRTIYEIEKANITRVIDGDTFETNLGKVRLLGINAPERKMAGHEEARNFLLGFEGKEVELVKLKENKDKYGRLLRYAFYNKQLINEEILLRGLAHLYYYQEDKYTNKLKKAEEKARTRQIGIWQESRDRCKECIVLVELNKIDPGEYVLLKNSCSFTCNLEDWTIKDNAVHIRKLNFSLPAGEQKKIEYKGRIWNDNSDSLYLRDSDGFLVLFHRY